MEVCLTMIELPEARTLADQLNKTVKGKWIAEVVAVQSPHKLTWYHGDPQEYPKLLAGKKIGQAEAYGGLVEIEIEEVRAVFSDGVNLRFHAQGEKRPPKHQLLLEFTDGTGLSASVQMYGGIQCFRDGELDNPYYQVAKAKPSPLSGEFDQAYFDSLITSPEVQKLSAKAFLATEQRIPGLGNGVLQDLLYLAKVHPKQKVRDLSAKERESIFSSLKNTLAEMTAQGGRDTEKDLFGRPGGYKTRLSKNTAGKACPVCSSPIIKESYLGGSIYYCAGCQKLQH